MAMLSYNLMRSWFVSFEYPLSLDEVFFMCSLMSLNNFTLKCEAELDYPVSIC